MLAHKYVSLHMTTNAKPFIVVVVAIVVVAIVASCARIKSLMAGCFFISRYFMKDVNLPPRLRKSWCATLIACAGYQPHVSSPGGGHLSHP